MMAGLNSIDVSRNDVRNFGCDDEVGRQSALECKATERNRPVEQDCRNKKLWRQEIDDPGEGE